MKLSNDTIAKVAHEVNRAYCFALGDASQPRWEDAPTWQRDSALKGVAAHVEDPGITPRGSHLSWLKEKLDNGWCYGPIKDANIKTHPCIVEYEHLPREQQVKDHLFSAIVKQLATIDVQFNPAAPKGSTT